MSTGDISLPFFEDEDCNDYNSPSPRQVLRIAINLKLLIDTVIPVRFDPKFISDPGSPILNSKVLKSVYNSAGGEGFGKRGSTSKKYQAVLPFCLLKVSGWYEYLAVNELHDNELYNLRSLVAQTLAVMIIENEKDDKYLFISMLCHRIIINLHDSDASPQSALELAVDMHSTIVISCSGFQRCIKWLWRGWIVQSQADPSDYVLYKGLSSPNFIDHFNPERIKTPMYQNALEIFFSIVYLLIYTYIVNTETTVNLNFMEITFMIFTFGLIYDEFVKFYHIGINYLQFWNSFNDTMFCIIVTSFVFRFLSLETSNPDKRDEFQTISFRVLSLAAPFMWNRLLLYLDVYEFVGAMIVVLKTMIKESAYFFVLLAFIIIGFSQAFIGVDQADGERDVTQFLITVLFRTVLGGANFNAMERFAAPYGSILYYSYTFIVTLCLLNILIALYSTAYTNISDNSTQEYLAITAQKTLRYIRAPDEAVFVPPLNVIELFCLSIPFRAVLSAKNYARLTYCVMYIIYSPLLILTSFYEVKSGKRVQYNRSKFKKDDDNEDDLEWDLEDGYDEDVEQETNERNIRESLRAQRRAELEDPTFLINYQSWKNDLPNLAPPVWKSIEAGVTWETFEILNKIDELTKNINSLVEETKKININNNKNNKTS
ncbi:unnamed protein product [[Candida] boidinii]|nr:unnamed protein product [[Candida] boidinii]